MRLKDWFVPFLVFIATTQAFASGISAHRLPGENYEEASARFHQDTISRGRTGSTPESVQVPLTNLDISSIPALSSTEILLAEFNYIRDTKFIQGAHLQFPRRISWLYPDDGCYVRAEMAANALVRQGAPLPKKIFVFGNLQATTPNAVLGYVQWWYHVAVTYRVGNTAYVFDPAINAKAPLTLKEWNTAVGGDLNRVKYAVCNHDAFDPGSACDETRPYSESTTLREQFGFLDSEWERLLELHRDPYTELRDNPPWTETR